MIGVGAGCWTRSAGVVNAFSASGLAWLMLRLNITGV